MVNDDAAALVDIDGFRAMMREAGIEEAVASTLQIFLAEAGPIFKRLEVAVAADDAASTAAAAHALKSSSSNVWATGLVPLLDVLEDLGRDGEMGGAAALLEDVRPLYAAVIAHVRRSIP
jgi:HPt (histidine-containing phosphotransfer) domain-containing protein